MAGQIYYLSILTLNVNGLNFQLKDTDRLNGLRNKTHLFAAYKKHIFLTKMHTLKVKGWIKKYDANRNEKRAGIAILI